MIIPRFNTLELEVFRAVPGYPGALATKIIIDSITFHEYWNLLSEIDRGLLSIRLCDITQEGVAKTRL